MDDRLAGIDLGGAAGLERRDSLGHKRCLLLDDGVVDGSAEALVEDLNAVELGRGAGAVLVGRGDGDIEGQDLIGEPGQRGFLETLHGRQRNVIERGGVGLVDRGGNVLHFGGVEDSGSVGDQVEVLLERKEGALVGLTRVLRYSYEHNKRVSHSPFVLLPIPAPPEPEP